MGSNMNIQPDSNTRQRKYPTIAATTLAVTAALASSACSQNRDVMILGGLVQYNSPEERRNAVKRKVNELKNQREITTEDGSWVRVPVESVKKTRP